jgi:hypothetical protein
MVALPSPAGPVQLQNHRGTPGGPSHSSTARQSGPVSDSFSPFPIYFRPEEYFSNGGGGVAYYLAKERGGMYTLQNTLQLPSPRRGGISAVGGKT